MITLIIILIISLIIADLILIDSKRQLAEQKKMKLIEKTVTSPFGEWRREKENECVRNGKQTTNENRTTRERIGRRKNKKSKENRKTFLHSWINAINNFKKRFKNKRIKKVKEKKDNE